MSGYTIIDVDTHVTETPDLWTSRAPASMRDRVPRVETDNEGRLSWVVGENKGLVASPGLTATAGVEDSPVQHHPIGPGGDDGGSRAARVRVGGSDVLGHGVAVG